MGRYVPPEHEGIVSGNALHKRHPLGARASRLASEGVLIVRFEMPFAVWCATCPRPTLIPQGVRFNAEKKRVGNYHTTPIWSFRIKHTDCGGWLELRTDPRQGDFVVVSGGRRRDYGAGSGDDDSLVKMDNLGRVFMTERERAEQREGAFSKLEKTIADRAQLECAKQRISELQETVTRQWEDPYTQNQRLRRAFRIERHGLERAAAKAEELKDRMGLSIELLPETEEDARRAALVDFRSVPSPPPSSEDGPSGPVIDKALAKPLFGDRKTAKQEDLSKSRNTGTPALSGGTRILKSELAAARARENLVSEIVSNTRASKDPFLVFDSSSRESTPRTPGDRLLPGLKRKREATEEPLSKSPPPPPAPPPPPSDTIVAKPKAVAGTTALVNYDSDSD